MGSFFSSPEGNLEPYKHEFEEPSATNYDFSGKTVYIIEDKLSAENALEILKKHGILYVDCEGANFGNDHAEVGLVQIAISEECCFLFKCTCKTEFDVLKEVLESNKIIKVFHDCSGDVAALAVARIGRQRGITVCNVEDTQIAYQYVLKSSNPRLVVKQLPKLSLANLYMTCFMEYCPHVKTHSIRNNKWLSGILDERMIKYASLDVLLLPKIFTFLKRNISREHLPDYKEMVEKTKNYKTKKLIHKW